jgi:hypothetical protein
MHFKQLCSKMGGGSLTSRNCVTVMGCGSLQVARPSSAVGMTRCGHDCHPSVTTASGSHCFPSTPAPTRPARVLHNGRVAQLHTEKRHGPPPRAAPVRSKRLTTPPPGPHLHVPAMTQSQCKPHPSLAACTEDRATTATARASFSLLLRLLPSTPLQLQVGQRGGATTPVPPASTCNLCGPLQCACAAPSTPAASGEGAVARPVQPCPRRNSVYPGALAGKHGQPPQVPGWSCSRFHTVHAECSQSHAQSRVP